MSFWDFFFLLLIYVPLALMWASALIDIFRRDDLGGLARAIWVATVIVLPFLGTLLYLVLRPAGATPTERAVFAELDRSLGAHRGLDSTAQQLATLSDLQDRGRITADEFAEEKARLLTGAGAPAHRVSV